MWFYVLQAASLGFSVAIAPGPLQAYLLAQTLRHGPRRTLPLILAPVVSDIPIIALVLFALAWLPEWALRGLQVAGGLLLLYMAFELYRTLRAHTADSSAPVSRFGAGQSFAKAVLMNALSPGPYIFWSTIAGPLFWRAWAEAQWLAYAFLAAFGVALVAGLAAYVWATGSTRHIDDRYKPLVNGAVAVVLLGFGAYQIYAGLFAPAAVAFAR